MRSLSILALFVSPAISWAQVQIDPPVCNLGGVRGGQAIECEFKIKNAGAEAVEIVDLERSCGCVEPRFGTRSLKPGEQTTLALRIRTLGQLEGPRSWPLTLVTRSSGATSKLTMEVRGSIANEIVMQPPQLALYVSKTLDQEITLVDRRDRPLAVTSWDAKMPGVRIEQLPSPAGTTRLKLSATAEQLPKGRHDHVLHLYTNDPGYAHLEVPVTVTRVEKPRVTWSPEPPEVFLAPGEAKGSAIVRVKSDTPIDKIETSDAGVTCVSREAADGTYLRVTVERERFDRSKVQAAVRVTCGSEVVAIPIVVRIE